MVMRVSLSVRNLRTPDMGTGQTLETASLLGSLPERKGM
jgi:hypothetical protein